MMFKAAERVAIALSSLKQSVLCLSVSEIMMTSPHLLSENLFRKQSRFFQSKQTTTSLKEEWS